MFKSILVAIFLLIFIGFIHNIGGNFFIGGDIQPLFFDYQLVFDSIYTRSGTGLLGGINSPGGNVLMIPNLLFIQLTKYFSDNGLLFYCILFVLSGGGCYKFFNYLFPKDKSTSLTFTLFFVLSLSYHYLFTRGVIFTQFIVVAFFYLATWMLQYFDTKNKKYLLYSLVASLFIGIISSNPGYFIPTILILACLGFSYCYHKGMKFTYFMEKFIIYCLFTFSSVLISFFSFLIFAHYNTFGSRLEDSR